VRIHVGVRVPYRVPSMAEVAEVAPNGYKVASTFSGAGGSSLGYRMAGFDVVYASEFVEAARDTYAANWPGATLDPRDIREVTADDLLRLAGVAAGELDILDGSPPCAAFSNAGRRAEVWGKVRKYSDTSQVVDDLFSEFVRILRGVQPKVFVAENVAGLADGVARGYFKEILGELKSSGYRVAARIVDSQWLGVPQARRRLIFLGVRDDLGLDPRHPAPQPHRYSILDAIGDLVPTEAELAENRIGKYAVGHEWDKMREGEGKSDKYFSMSLPDFNKPMPTVQASHGQPGIAAAFHSREKRRFTIRECQRLCSFPDDFILTGTYVQQWERLGRAVPPLMMKAVAATVGEILDETN